MPCIEGPNSWQRSLLRCYYLAPLHSRRDDKSRRNRVVQLRRVHKNYILLRQAFHRLRVSNSAWEARGHTNLVSVHPLFHCFKSLNSDLVKPAICQSFSPQFSSSLESTLKYATQMLMANSVKGLSTHMSAAVILTSSRPSSLISAGSQAQYETQFSSASSG